ncbi:MAG: restriction endonuclease subunit S, partial [Mariprofundaceae bacterium]|nr:restriction endonuclease subunit S [Mariprofundaceae bacterium]
MFGLDPDSIRNIKHAMGKIPIIDKAILYGSRAKGNDRDGSDIDITLFGQGITLNNSVYPLMDELHELYLPYTFDISIFKHIDNQDLVAHIHRVGKLFYEKEKKLPKGWGYGTLENAVKKGSSNISLNKIKDDDGDYPVFKAKGFAKNISFFQQEQEYLAVIKDGAGIGRVAKYPAKSSVIATMQYLIPKEGYDIGFIEYFLNGVDFEKHRSGSTIPHVYFKDYKSEAFPLIPLPEQQRIVKVLDEAFVAIDKAKQNAEQNLRNAKEVFENYLQGVFENKGDNWEEKSLGEVVNIKTGKLNSNAMVKNGKYPFFTCSRKIFAINEYSFDCKAVLLAGNNASGDFNVKYYEGKFNAYQRTYVITINSENELLYSYLKHK